VAEDGYHRALEIRKGEFVQKDLPDVFKTMTLLNLKLDDLVQLYKKHFSLP